MNRLLEQLYHKSANCYWEGFSNIYMGNSHLRVYVIPFQNDYIALLRR